MGANTIEEAKMATSRFGGKVAEQPELPKTEAPTSRFGGNVHVPQAADPEFAERSAILDAPLGYRILEKYGRPMFQAFGGGVGALAASPTSLVTGPAGPVVGGALGFAMGDEIIDLIQDWMGYRKPTPLMTELIESAWEVGEGAMYEMGGSFIPIAGRGGKQVWDWASSKFTAKGAEEAAGKVLASATAHGDILAKNIEEAMLWEKEVPGLKFDLAQMTDEPGVLKYLEEGEGLELTNLFKQRKADNTKALQDWIETKRGTAGAEDFLAPLKHERLGVKSAVEEAGEAFKGEKIALKAGETPAELSLTIHDIGKTAEREAAKEGSKEFKKLPQVELPEELIGGFHKKLKEIMKPHHKREQADKFPEILNKTIKDFDEMLEETGTVTDTAKDLQGLRSELSEDLRQLKLPQSFKNRLNQAIDAIDDVLTSEGIGKEWEAARKNWLENVVKKYRRGSVGEALKGESDAMVAGRFFKPGDKGQQVASEFMRTFGDDPNAKKALTDYIDQSVLALKSGKADEISTTALNSWLKKHEFALTELGLTDRYGSLSKARAAMDEALANKAAFDRTAASKALGEGGKGDIDKAVDLAFFGKGSKKIAAEELMSRMKTPQQVSGLQNAMIDEILKEAPIGATPRELLKSEAMKNKLQKYDAAIKVVFKDAPEKIKAMEDARGILKRLEMAEKVGKGKKELSFFEGLARKYRHGRETSRNISGEILHQLKKLTNQKQIDEIIKRAIFDPNIAFGLARAARGGNMEKVMKPLIDRLIVAGLISAPSPEEALESALDLTTYSGPRTGAGHALETLENE